MNSIVRKRFYSGLNKRDELVQYLTSDRINHVNSTSAMEDDLNSLRSLTDVSMLKTKEQLLKDIMGDRHESKVLDGAKLKYRQMKNLFKFFQIGLNNVWKVNKSLRGGLYGGERYLIDYKMDINKNKIVVKKREYNMIITLLSDRIHLLKKEHGKSLDSMFDDLKQINRKEFVEMTRDKENFIKLPIFGGLFLLIEELSLPLVYIFPNMLPSTCILPGMLENRYFSKSRAAFKKLKEMNGFTEDEEAHNFIAAIMLGKSKNIIYDTSRSTEKRLVCEIVGCKNLERHINEVLIDDYLIAKELRKGNRDMAVLELREFQRRRTGLLSGNGNGNKFESNTNNLSEIQNWLIKRFAN